jgi:hypothetical protein
MQTAFMKRSQIDRRSGDDERKLYSLDYFTNGGMERRHQIERRKLAERRGQWVRVRKWYSVRLYE